MDDPYSYSLIQMLDPIWKHLKSDACSYYLNKMMHKDKNDLLK